VNRKRGGEGRGFFPRKGVIRRVGSGKPSRREKEHLSPIHSREILFVIYRRGGSPEKGLSLVPASLEKQIRSNEGEETVSSVLERRGGERKKGKRRKKGRRVSGSSSSPVGKKKGKR